MGPKAQKDSAAALSRHTTSAADRAGLVVPVVNAAICAEVHWQPRSACRITSSATCPETKKAAAFQKLTVPT